MSKSHSPIAQASQIQYALHSLGWKAFQDLSVTIAQEVWKCPVQMFFDSHDGGRDGAFQIKENDSSREATIQCKFTAKPNNHISFSALSDDFEKAKRLAKKGLCDEYVLITNYQMKGTTAEELKEKFESIPNLKSFHAHGFEWVCNQIRNSSRLRMLVPRVYGLGDLSEILDERASKQANEILSSLGGDLDKFVMTSAFRKSSTALQDHNFVFLLGEPACGKSTIAATLSVGAIDEWKVRAFKPSGAKDFIEHSNPNDKNQLFWIDDAFGATQLDRQAVEDWNRAFPHVNAAIKRGARFIFTSRDYIFEAAKRYLKQTAIPVIKESQVVIKVEDLQEKEKQQVLYNHIRLGNQTQEFRKKLKPFLTELAKHEGFSPELARRLGNSLFTQKLDIDEEGLDEFFSEPVDFLCDVIETLDAPNKAALALVFMRGGEVNSPVNVTSQEETNMELLGSSAGAARTSLRELKNSLLILAQKEGGNYWKFKHPTVRDAFSKLISANPELLEIYLQGTPLDAIFEEATCGSIDLEGNYVNIPHALYPLLIKRIGLEDGLKKNDKRSFRSFLSYRCDKCFLELIIESNPTLISNLRVDPWSFSGDDAGLLATLLKFGLLPDESRKQAALEVVDHSISRADSAILSDEYRPFFPASTYRRRAKRALKKILDDIEDTIQDTKDMYSSGDPSDTFDELVYALEDYKEFFKKSPEIQTSIEGALDDIQEAINDIEPVDDEPSDSSSLLSSEEVSNNEATERSIFDDVDE